MKSILELFADDEIEVVSRYYQHSKEYLKKYKNSSQYIVKL